MKKHSKPRRGFAKPKATNLLKTPPKPFNLTLEDMTKIARLQVPKDLWEDWCRLFLIYYTCLRLDEILKTDTEEHLKDNCLLVLASMLREHGYVPLHPVLLAMLKKCDHTASRTNIGLRFRIKKEFNKGKNNKGGTFKKILEMAGIENPEQVMKGQSRYQLLNSETLRANGIHNMRLCGLTNKDITLLTGHELQLQIECKNKEAEIARLFQNKFFDPLKYISVE